MNKQDKKDKGAGHGKFPKKLAGKLPEGFIEKAEAMTLEDLKKSIVESERTISSTERDMKNDSKLESVKEEVKALADVYKDILGTHSAMIKLMIFVIEERGVV